MIIIPEENWIEISRVFLDAFEQFWNEGRETQMIELNNRQIEISFFKQELCYPHRFNVILFRLMLTRSSKQALIRNLTIRQKSFRRCVSLPGLRSSRTASGSRQMTAKKNMSRSEKFCSMFIMTVLRSSA